MRAVQLSTAAAVWPALVALALLAHAGVARADGIAELADSPCVAVIDVQAVLLSIPGAASAGAKLFPTINAAQRDLGRQEAQLRTLEQRIASASKDVSRALLDSKRADYDRRQAAFQRAVRAHREKLAEQARVLAPFVREITLAAERVRARRRFSIVVDSQQPAATGEDITRAVQQELDARLRDLVAARIARDCAPTSS